MDEHTEQVLCDLAEFIMEKMPMIEQNERELFKLVAPYKPTGDQPEAIAKLVEGIKRGDKEQTLLGVTGSGKTFTMANIIQ